MNQWFVALFRSLMKIKHVIIGLLVCAAVVLCVAISFCEQKRLCKYEFHTGADGQIIWQCNRQTGEIKVFTSYTADYQLFQGKGQDYLLNRQTGETWRYFQNGTNSNPSEGFGPLPHESPVAIQKSAAALPKIGDAPVSFVPDASANDITPSQH